MVLVVSASRSSRPTGICPPKTAAPVGETHFIACRSAALGGHLWRCEACRAEVYAYHSCGNRSYPRCHRNQTERWLAARTAELLDAPYFHITVTVPAAALSRSSPGSRPMAAARRR